MNWIKAHWLKVLALVISVSLIVTTVVSTIILYDSWGMTDKMNESLIVDSVGGIIFASAVGIALWVLSILLNRRKE